MNSILNEAKLKKLPRPIRKEAVVTPKIMHFGPGAFFRSFVASLIDKVNQYDIEKWGIVAVSLNSEGTFDKLEGQDFVFNALSELNPPVLYTFLGSSPNCITLFL